MCFNNNLANKSKLGSPIYKYVRPSFSYLCTFELGGANFKLHSINSSSVTTLPIKYHPSLNYINEPYRFLLSLLDL